MKFKIEAFANESEVDRILANVREVADSFTYSRDKKTNLRVIEANCNENIAFDIEDATVYNECLTYKISIEGQENDLVGVEGVDITKVLSIAFKDKDETSKNSLINEILENYWKNIKEDTKYEI